MLFISWNVNGLRACLEKGFMNYFNEMTPFAFSIQETKMQEGQANIDIEGYYKYMSSAIKKGYSGTLIYVKEKPISVVYGIDDEYNDEGRVITLEYDNFYLVNAYVPNSQEGLKRLDYRMIFEDKLRDYLVSLDAKKPVIYCGDLNVAHKEIDIKNPKANLRNAGFTIEERTKMSTLLDSGFTDTFRYLHPDTILYSWWSYRFNARANNAGWRIDYFLVSNRINHLIKNAEIHTSVYGSDHCPVLLELDL